MASGIDYSGRLYPAEEVYRHFGPATVLTSDSHPIQTEVIKWLCCPGQLLLGWLTQNSSCFFWFDCREGSAEMSATKSATEFTTTLLCAQGNTVVSNSIGANNQCSTHRAEGVLADQTY